MNEKQHDQNMAPLKINKMFAPLPSSSYLKNVSNLPETNIEKICVKSFINFFVACTFKNGLKSVVSTSMHNLLEELKKNKLDLRDLKLFIENLKIRIGMRIFSVKGKPKLSPYAIAENDAQKVFIKTFLADFKKNNKTSVFKNEFKNKLVSEITLAKTFQGASVNKMEDLYSQIGRIVDRTSKKRFKIKNTTKKYARLSKKGIYAFI